MLSLQSVSKTFPGRDGRQVVALDSVVLDIAAGEMVTVVGPSGSGKSTLLFTAGGMQHPTSGRVVLAGREVYALGAAERAALRRRDLGFVFQTFNLVPYLTCEENVALPAILDGRRRTDALAAARDLLMRLGLEPRLRHRPAELSVGERQRVAIARALVNAPKVLLADEPTGNLDAENAAEVVRTLEDLHREGQTIVLVTHDLRLADRGDRRVELRAGSVEASVTLREDAA